MFHILFHENLLHVSLKCYFLADTTYSQCSILPQTRNNTSRKLYSARIYLFPEPHPQNKWIFVRFPSPQPGPTESSFRSVVVATTKRTHTRTRHGLDNSRRARPDRGPCRQLCLGLGHGHRGYHTVCPTVSIQFNSKAYSSSSS